VTALGSGASWSRFLDRSMTMKTTPDPRIAYEPELALRTQGTWMPALAQKPRALDVTRWQSRAAHGFSWHRSGRAASRPRGVH
jgi:hypothetical protein